MDSIQLDPIADDPPDKYPKWEMLFIAILLAVAAFEIYNGELSSAFSTAIFVGLFYILIKSRRVYWMSGYHKAVKSMREEMNRATGDE